MRDWWLVMEDFLHFLIEIQSIESSEKQPASAQARMEELRAKVPPQTLAHHDRLVARGKKSIAAVRRQTCTACHVSVPLGTVMALRHRNDVQRCGNCGRYLYLEETPEPVVDTPKKSPRRRKPAPLIPA
jgi:predicted  nucleic acid-binding Zn-ribbon protein